MALEFLFKNSGHDIIDVYQILNWNDYKLHRNLQFICHSS